MATIEHIMHEGKPFVMLPEALFNRLVEDAEMLEDIKAYDAAKARMADGSAEFFPQEVVMADCNARSTGEAVAVWMRFRGLTQTMLAEKSGVNRVYLSEIINNKKPGSVDALKHIAVALHVDLDMIVR